MYTQYTFMLATKPFLASHDSFDFKLQRNRLRFSKTVMFLLFVLAFVCFFVCLFFVFLFVCCFFLILFSIMITSLGEEGAGLCVSRAFICLFLHASISVLFLMIGCGLYLWHSLDFYIRCFGCTTFGRLLCKKCIWLTCLCNPWHFYYKRIHNKKGIYTKFPFSHSKCAF